KAFGIPQRAGMDLVIAAVALDVHGAFSRSHPVMPGHSNLRRLRKLVCAAGHPRLRCTSARKTWMAGTSPVMTMLGLSLYSAAIFTGSSGRSSPKRGGPLAHTPGRG